MQRVIFLHIFKTGGTSIRSDLGEYFGENNTMPVPYVSETGHYPRNTIPVADFGEGCRLFECQQARRYSLVMGHYDWTIREQIPEYAVLTMLREPIALALSLFHHQRYRYRLLKGRLDESNAKRALRQWLEMVTANNPLYLNWASLQLSGYAWGNDLSTAAADDVLRLASQNLATVDWFGITDRYQESLARLSRQVGIRLRGSWVNRGCDHGLGQLLPSDLDSLLRQKLASLVEIDLALFREAEKLWAQAASLRRRATFWFGRAVRGSRRLSSISFRPCQLQTRVPGQQNSVSPRLSRSPP